tara:strand:+ start:172 stop:519 length:348 start_codon:yes stop_codon:yes gene_type:complete
MKKFSRTKPTIHNQKKKFNPNRYGKLWSGIELELADKPAFVEKDTQPIMGYLKIDNKKIGITWSESNRIIETLLDGQHRHKVAQRLGMLEKGHGTPRDIKFKSYDANGNVVATNM